MKRLSTQTLKRWLYIMQSNWTAANTIEDDWLRQQCCRAIVDEIIITQQALTRSVASSSDGSKSLATGRTPADF